jgi:hypothetical protein
VRHPGHGELPNARHPNFSAFLEAALLTTATTTPPQPVVPPVPLAPPEATLPLLLQVEPRAPQEPTELQPQPRAQPQQALQSQRQQQQVAPINLDRVCAKLNIETAENNTRSKSTNNKQRLETTRFVLYSLIKNKIF